MSSKADLVRRIGELEESGRMLRREKETLERSNRQLMELNRDLVDQLLSFKICESTGDYRPSMGVLMHRLQRPGAGAQREGLEEPDAAPPDVAPPDADAAVWTGTMCDEMPGEGDATC